MPKPEYLLQFKSSQKMGGFIYVVDNESKFYDFKVKTNINNQKEWSDIGVKDVARYRDGGTTIINLERNPGNFKKIYIPVRQEELAYIEMENGKQWYLDDLNTTSFQYTDIEGTPIPVVPFIPLVSQEQQEKNYDFNDLVNAVNNLTKAYGVTTRSDIFEHTMLRLSGVPFPFNGYYKFDQSKRNPEYFFMDLGLSGAQAKEFARSLNEKYGNGTAEYTPSFNQGNNCAVRLKLSTVIEKILPGDFKENLEKTFSDGKMKLAYQKPYNELDEDLQIYVKKSAPKSKMNEESIANLLNQFSFITLNQEKISYNIQSSMPTKEDIATAFGLNEMQSNSIQVIKKGLPKEISITTDDDKQAKQIEAVFRKELEAQANKPFGELIRLSNPKVIELSFDAMNAFFEKINAASTRGLCFQ